MPSRRIPPDQRKRTEMSCDKCKARKQKCHRPLAAPPTGPPSARPLALSPAAAAASSSSPSSSSRDDARQPGAQHPPCRYCQTHNYVCVTTQPRKKRGTYYAGPLGPDGALDATRAALLEGLVRGLVPDADTASVDGLRALGLALGISMPDADGPTDLDAPRETDVGGGGENDPEPPAGQDDVLAARDEGDVGSAGNGLPDCAGQTQYIGASSSYTVQLRVRAMLTGLDVPARLFLFAGSSTGDAEQDVTRVLSASSPSSSFSTDRGLEMQHAPRLLPGDTMGVDHMKAADTDALVGPVAESLIAAFFAHFHPSFPVLDEAAFRTAYATVRVQPDAAAANPAWLCSLYCIFLLSYRFAPAVVPLGQALEVEEAWWHRVRSLLPTVLLTSSPAAVQALLLVAAYLGNTNRRDSCWTLTGAAVRIAVAVGLHMHIHHHHRPPPATFPDGAGNPRHLETLWWTLYHFELLQAASLDRPSAIPEETPSPQQLHSQTTTPLPQRALSLLLARAYRVARAGHDAASSLSSSSSSIGPASPAATLLRDLRQWRDALPTDLCLDGIQLGDLPPPPREVLLLHVEFHHVLCVLARGAMLRRTADGTPLDTPAAPGDLPAVGAQAARDSVDLLLVLEAAGCMDVYGWWDVYFLYQAVLVLGLHVASEARGQPPAPAAAADDVARLQRAAAVAERIEADPAVPGTMRRYAVVVREVAALVQQQQPYPAKGGGEVKWHTTACEPEPTAGMAGLMPPPPSHDDVLGVMSQVSFPMPSAEFGLVDGGFWMGAREGWGDFMGFGT